MKLWTEIAEYKFQYKKDVVVVEWNWKIEFGFLSRRLIQV